MISLSMLFSLMCAAVVQALWPTWGWLGYAHAPLLLGLVLYYALTHDLFFLLAACFLAGILQDSLGLIPLGYSAFCFCVVGLIVIRSRELMFVRQWTTHLALGAVSAAGVSLALSLILVLNDQVSMTLPQIAIKVWGSLALGAILVPLEFRMLERLDRYLGNIAREDF